MSDLIRGGQVTFHKYRMLMQVGKVLSRLALCLIIVSISYSYYKNISYNEWRVGIAWVKSDIVQNFKKDYKVTYPGKWGEIKTLSHESFNRDQYVNKTIEKFKITLYKALTVVAIMLTTVIGGLLLFFWLKGRKIKKSINIRGVFLITATALKRKISNHNKLFKNYKPFKLANFSYPITGRVESWSSGEQSHTMILGSTGAGKTKIIQDLVYQLHRRNQKAIIIDVKGDYIENFYRPSRGDIILNPLDVRGRNWSIFNETNPLKGFSTIAKSLLPRGSSNDPIWVDSARAVFSEMANLYVSENLSMAEFADKILKTELKTLEKLLSKTGASKIINQEIEKAALSVLMVLSTYLRPLKLYRSSDSCFSITDWVNDESQNNFLFISSRADVKEDINPLITAQVDIAVNALRSLTKASSTPKTWFILDEISYFDQSIPNLKDGLAMSRSYGGCFVLGTQDMSSLSKIYSENIAKSIANNCRTKIYMNIAGKESAEYCSQSLGEGEVEEWHEGLSYGAHEMRDGIQVNRSRIIRKTVLASEFMLLKAGEGFINFAGFEPAKFKFSDCSFKKVAPGYIENKDLLVLFKKELGEGEKWRKETEENIANKAFSKKHLSKKELQLEEYIEEEKIKLIMEEPQEPKEQKKQKEKKNLKQQLEILDL